MPSRSFAQRLGTVAFLPFLPLPAPAKLLSRIWQSSCHNAQVVQTTGLRCGLIRRTQHGPSYLLPRFRSLAVFVRRPRVRGTVRDGPASENHHTSGNFRSRGAAQSADLAVISNTAGSM